MPISAATQERNKLLPWSARCRVGAHWACQGRRGQGRRGQSQCECPCHWDDELEVEIADVALCPIHWPDACSHLEVARCRPARIALQRLDMEYQLYWRNHRVCRGCRISLPPGTSGKIHYHPECKPRYAVEVA